MHLYNVPVIQQDLRQEETIIQAINALQYLNNVIEDIFDRIENRIESNNKKLQNINSRIQAANQKVESLVGINKAINIFSPAKYPAANVFRNIEKTFTLSENHKPLILNEDYEVSSGLDSHHKNIQEKLQFYHVKTESIDRIKLNPIMPTEGLGNIPSNITSINALLLFNTEQNPYENYKTIDPLSLPKVSTSTNTQASSSGMEAAPISISDRTQKNKRFVDNLLYTPGVNEAPELDVPLYLPDLPGIIADDITYNSQDNEPQIAPSNAKSHIQLDLLILPEPEPEESVEFKMNSNVQLPEIPEIPIQVLAPVAQKNVEHTESPPPPPPPPILPLPSKIVSDPIKDVAQVQKIDDTDSARSSLMDAIRKAGGKAKLRASEQKPTEQTEKKDFVGNNLMADLHNKLSMRRKGISGAKDGQNTGILDKVSAMIPPPPKRNSTTDASDEDWE